MGKIKTILEAYNYAPLKKFKGEIDSDNLCITIYADNGEGKTFISKAFRVTETNEMPESDKYITFGETKGSFSCCISNEGCEVDKFEVNFEQGKLASCKIPKKFIFHTFNQDFIDENIRSFSFDKKKDHIDGYIIGKSKINLKEEEEKRDAIVEVVKKKHEKIFAVIDEQIRSINNIPNIRRIAEYTTLLNQSYIFTNYKTPIGDISKSLKQYIDEYDRIKSIPENVDLLIDIALPLVEWDVFDEINEALKESFSVSNIAEDFKEKIKTKQQFIEEGVKLFSKDNKCPFCERPIISGNELELLDQYIAYFNEEEAKHIKKFNGYIEKINLLKHNIKKTNTEALTQKSKSSDYIIKYIPSATNSYLDDIEITNLSSLIDEIIDTLKNKIANISVTLDIDTALKSIKNEYATQQSIVSSNNAKIATINRILTDSAEANRSIRRNICKSLYNEIILKVGTHIDECIKLTEEKDKLITSINDKRKAERISRLDKVSETIKSILNVFFRGKYTFNETTFLLQCHGTALSSGQASHVLSEGEKSIIAFAYYLGDVFVKIKDEEDYDKLFFVIDDPISSMDFNYVYILSTIIRNLTSYIPIPNHQRIIMLTHNLEFLRIIVGNRIMGNCYVLKDGQLKKFNSNHTIPYISHLNDIYQASIGKASINHTTANSIRHILESIMKFENPYKNASLEEYVRVNLPEDKHTYTLIQDLSHGGLRAEMQPIKEADYLKICKYVVALLSSKYPGQIEYCKTLV